MSFNCTYCEKVFSTKSVRNFHIKIAHRNEVKWQCARCGDLFPSKSLVEYHEDVCSAHSSTQTENRECVVSPMSLKEFVPPLEKDKSPEPSTSMFIDNLPLIEPKTEPKSPKRREDNAESEEICTVDLTSASSSPGCSGTSPCEISDVGNEVGNEMEMHDDTGSDPDYTMNGAKKRKTPKKKRGRPRIGTSNTPNRQQQKRNAADIDEWFNTMKEAIAGLPSPQAEVVQRKVLNLFDEINVDIALLRSENMQ